MAYSFDFKVDARRNIVTITMAGFFEEAAVSPIATGMANALRQLHCEPNQHLTLVDVTGCQIQSQNIVGAFQKMVGNQAFRSRRLAFVTGSSLIKMQLRRLITDGTYSCIFEDVSSARQWLLREVSTKNSDGRARAITGFGGEDHTLHGG